MLCPFGPLCWPAVAAVGAVGAPAVGFWREPEEAAIAEEADAEAPLIGTGAVAARERLARCGWAGGVEGGHPVLVPAAAGRSGAPGRAVGGCAAVAADEAKPAACVSRRTRSRSTRRARDASTREGERPDGLASAACGDVAAARPIMLMTLEPRDGDGAVAPFGAFEHERVVGRGALRAPCAFGSARVTRRGGMVLSNQHTEPADTHARPNAVVARRSLWTLSASLLPNTANFCTVAWPPH